MDDAKDPASLLIAGRDKGHAQSGDDPEGDDADRCADAVGRDFHADLAVRDGEAEDAGGNHREADAPIENKIDAIALHAQQGLTDEVEDGAANRRAKQRCMERAYAAGAPTQLARVVRSGAVHELAHPAHVSEWIGERGQSGCDEQRCASGLRKPACRWAAPTGLPAAAGRCRETRMADSRARSGFRIGARRGTAPESTGNSSRSISRTEIERPWRSSESLRNNRSPRTERSTPCRARMKTAENKPLPRQRRCVRPEGAADWADRRTREERAAQGNWRRRESRR